MDALKSMTRFIVLGLLALWPLSAGAMPAHELAARLRAGEALVVVDVRPAAEYAKAHIPGAINIPARLVAHKRLPALGTVVVVGDALDVAQTGDAQRALSAREGIQALALDGGFEAWRELGDPVAGPEGRRRAEPRAIRYPRLTKAARTNPGLVLVDLRAKHLPAEDGLSRPVFVGVDRVSARAMKRRGADHADVIARVVSQAKARPDAVFVLVDDGDGTSEVVARRLSAAGVHRAVVLMGGAYELEAEGRTQTRTITSGGPPKRVITPPDMDEGRGGRP